MKNCIIFYALVAAIIVGTQFIPDDRPIADESHANGTQAVTLNDINELYPYLDQIYPPPYLDTVADDSMIDVYATLSSVAPVVELDFSKYENDVTVNIYFGDDDYQVTVGDLHKLLKETEK